MGRRNCVVAVLGLIVCLDVTPVSGQETLPTFAEIGRASGLNLVGHGRGSAWADLDGDGLEDFGLGLMRGGLSVPGGFWFYRNQGNLQFEERREDTGLFVDGTIYGVTFPDVDNDGDSDVFLNAGGYQSFESTAQVNRLFLNDGSGNFTEVPDAGGLALLGYNFTSAWDDVNGDTLLDVFICRLQADGDTPDRRLFLNRGNATFEDITVSAGLHSLKADSHQPLFFDMDNDGDPDLALANRDRRIAGTEPPWPPNQLYRNEGNGQFVDVSDVSGISEGIAGFVTEVADYDRDGDLDLFMGAYNNQASGEFVPNAHDCLYRNDGDGRFVEVAEEAGVAVVGGSMGARFWDFDNDGFPDLYSSKGGAEPGRVEYDLVFHNQGDGTFVKVGEQIGVKNRTGGHGATACDADYDGDLDLLVPSGSMLPGTEARSLFYENLGPTGSFIVVKPRGEAGNKDAVGALVEVRYGDVRTIGQVTAGSGYSGMPPAKVWFGVGDVTVIDEVTVTWRSGSRRTGRNIPADSRLVVLPPVAFDLLSPQTGKLDPITSAAPVQLRWEDPRPSGQGWFEVTITGDVEGVSLPIVVETDVPEFLVDLPPGKYDFDVKLVDDLGDVSEAELEEFVVEPTPVTTPRLLASPNPFQGSVAISGLLPPGSPPMEVEIIDATGARVAILAPEAGDSQVVWDGRTAQGRLAPAGIYWVRLRSSTSSASVKLVRL